MDNTISNLDMLDKYRVKSDIPYWLVDIKQTSDLYKKYVDSKNNSKEETEKLDEKQVKFLSVLDKLGFPMNEVGTYLYKDVLMSTYDEIMSFSKEDASEKAEYLLEELNDKYSNLYHMIAREEYDIGNNVFHYYITKAFGMRDFSKVDDTFKDAIFGVDYEEENYTIQTFRIASYMAKKDKKNIIQKASIK